MTITTKHLVSLFSMQMNYQLILVHWPCRTLGDHRQLYSKHLPPSVKHNLKTQTHQIGRSTGHTQTNTSEHTDIISITERRLNLLSVSPFRGAVQTTGPVCSCSPLLLQLWNNIWLSNIQSEVINTLNKGLNMFHLRITGAECMMCTTLWSAKHVSLVSSTQMLFSFLDQRIYSQNTTK